MVRILLPDSARTGPRLRPGVCMSWLREDKLLLLCCRTEIGDKERNKLTEIQINKIDWDCFLDKAREEGISPIVFLMLPKIVTDKNIIPGYVTDELKKDYYLSAKKKHFNLKRIRKYP